MKTQWKRAAHVIQETDPTVVQRYLRYWMKIRPQGVLDYYHRWLFAFSSIRNTWQMNCRLFIALKKLPRYFNREQLEQVILGTRTGMYEVRTRALWEFHLKYWADPKAWLPHAGEPLNEARTRMRRTLHGIGIAKTSFVFEMAWPSQSEVACLDTHILQLYGAGTGTTDSKYLELEKHWCEQCQERQLPSPIVRHIYWDKLRGQPNTKYWSHVLHPNIYAFQPPRKVSA